MLAVAQGVLAAAKGCLTEPEMKVKNFGIILTHYNLATLFNFVPYNIKKMMDKGRGGLW